MHKHKFHQRWDDMKHGSWLSKNIRPITLIFLTIVFVIFSVFDGNLGEFTIGESYVPVYQTLLITHEFTQHIFWKVYRKGKKGNKIKGK